METVLGLRLSQGEWRDLADQGFRAWGIEPFITAHGNQRLSNLARQGGFPAAAMASGASWPRKFLERAVGELLGSDAQDIGTAVATCERNEYLLPTIWRSQEMYAICGELALKIVELRAFADKEVPADGRPYSARLDQAYEDWRDELPMTLDGAAAGLIDTLLEAKKLSSSGSIRVGRLISQHGEEWRECLDFHLDGRWDDKDQLLSPGNHVRVFLQPSDGLADRISGRLAYLEHEDANRWIARPMRSEAAIEFPFDLPVTAEFHARGDRLARSFMLPGGKRVSSGLRVFERRSTNAQHTAFALIGQGSGAYKAEPVLIDVSQDWSVRGKDGNAEIELEDFAFAPGRRLYRCAGTIIAQKSNGDSFLVRTGQSADRKDRLSIVANSVSGVQSPDGEQLFKHPLHAQVSDGLSHRVASRGEVRWRFAGQRSWSEDLAAAGPGLCEFAWLDGSTGHVRDRLTAFVLPAAFELTQRSNGTYADIELSGWDWDAVLGEETPSSQHSWRIRIDPPRRALLTLRLALAQASAFDLKVPLQSKEWLTTWGGDLLPRDAVLGLADLRDTVARVPSTSILMGEVAHHAGAALDADWRIDGELGLSALRTDIAALMRPLGIDAQVRLDFHNGSNDHWYVTEFGNTLEWEPNGGLRPRTAIVGEDVRVCGRSLGAPEKELEFGSYDGMQSGLGGQLIHLPRLNGDWLVYLREGSRVLTRPKFVSGDPVHEVPQHRLGRAMAQPFVQAQEDLQSLVAEIAHAPTTAEASQTIQVVMKLALSLNGLPPQTFEIFSKLVHAGALAPLLLYRCEEQHLSTVLELFDGLCSSWTLLPYGAWDAAFQAQGYYLVTRLDDPQWALTRLTERQNEIAARAPQLAPLICRDFSPATWEDVRSHFTDHTSEGISTDASGFNPFRPAFHDLLPKENFLESLMRVFDAPFVAALAAMGRVTLDKGQILTVKDVERRHPAYFAKAYGYALTELKNDR
ncbi:STY4851/ECs_5259 family protein [Novosphingobium panipatense]